MARRPVKGAPTPAAANAVVEVSAPAEPHPKGALPDGVQPPQRLLRAYSFMGGLFNRGRFEWKPGEIIHDPAEIAYLRERGVLMESAAD